MLGQGTTLNDRYVLGDRLGGGGMGEVWRADDTVLGRTVAVKVLIPALTENPSFAQRFQNEARAMATLRHPGVVDVYDYGVAEVDGRQVSFLVMAYVPGESLDRVLRRGPLGIEATMRLVVEVADALAAAHAQGIVHRDVKSANLMVKPGGGVVLTDFGIAHSVSAAHLTATGTMLCSAGYCAPEMATDSNVTPAVDVYALGVVAYECLTGELPFQGDTPVQIIFKHLNSPIPRLPDEVPQGPRQVVARALEKTPDARWASATLMAEAARKALTSPGTLPAAPHRRRRTLRVAVAVAAAVAVSVGVAGSVWMRPADQSTVEQAPEPTVAGTATETSPTAPATARRESSPPVRRTAGPKPTRVTAVPTTPSAPVTSTPPTKTPTASPTTSEPEPTPEPTTPGPEEPPTSEPTISADPGEIQCVREPCP
ncbi:serine/threonine protein kinase [Nonomuraea solani]|uniref:non-specific serine/threonine protein kinase n=1 Tax=Nonomuraea solani TaxID=1144553 RepID=A0A1H6DPB0_9ACTN|nr:serine/threonine-protein kinase [Nonomuraea solani]SEG87152.1 serine/threonine protein kinase [Nonomuraea solani]